MSREEYYECNYGGNKLAGDRKNVSPFTPRQFRDAAASDHVQQAIAYADRCSVALAVHDNLTNNGGRRQEDQRSY
jgi:hypothetical protein